MTGLAVVLVLVPWLHAAVQRELAVPSPPEILAVNPSEIGALTPVEAISRGGEQAAAVEAPLPTAGTPVAAMGYGLPVPAASPAVSISPSDDDVPPFLYRIVSLVPSPRFDGQGFLLSHASRFEDEQGAKAFDPRSIPLATERDWETVARTQFFQPSQFGGHFQLLKIKTDRIRSLARREHGLLADHEYFGHVHRDDIVESRYFHWVFDRSPPQMPASILKAWGSWLFFNGSEGYSPKPLK